MPAEHIPTIIYDSNCRFCMAVREFLEKKSKRKFDFLPVQSPEARIMLRKKGISFIDLQTIFFVDHTSIKTRSKAVFKIFSLLPFPYSLISGFGILPVAFTDYFYKLIAKNRHRF
jgi:predicted DCC family thiol-disulfide oxidoreductase YuxK